LEVTIGGYKMKKFLSVLLILTLVLGLALGMAACGGGDKDASGDAAKEDVFTVGFIYIGTPEDGGFTQAQHEGTMAMEKHFGGDVKAIWEEEIDDTNKQAALDAAVRMIDQGADCIIGCSFGFMDALTELANNPDYADTKFLHFSGNEMNDTNYGNYFGATEEPRYLSGIIAGMQTESNKLGYVAAFPYTEVQIGINAFALGAQSVNPDVEVKTVFINSWYDPAKEKEAAEALLAQGCDIITQHADTPGPQQAAAEAGKFAIGYNMDNSKLEGLEKTFLTAPIWHHEKFLIPTVEAMIDGTWKPESYYGTMKDGYVGLSSLTANVTDEAKAKVEEVQAKIVAGEFPIFVGPIKDNKGAVKVPEGETLDRAGIWEIDYLVEGVLAIE
jgi:basic membrane protein A